MDKQSEEGWFTDPYGRHEARWLSQGEPTKLVRDGSTEAFDEPPDEAPTHAPLRIEAAGTGETHDDLRRADDGGRSGAFDAQLASRAAFDTFDLHARP